MLRHFASLVLVFLIANTAAAAGESGPVVPTYADCVRADTMVCTFRLVRSADLAAGRTATFSAPAGFPRIDHVELRRIDDDMLVLVEYFELDPALQGVAF